MPARHGRGLRAGGWWLVIATSAAVAVRSAPREFAGMAGAGNNAVRQLGGALGAAVVGVVFAARLHAGAGYAQAVHACAAALIALLVVTAAVLLLLRTGWEEPAEDPSHPVRPAVPARSG